MKNSPTLFSSNTEKWNTFGENPYPLSQSTKSTPKSPFSPPNTPKNLPKKAIVLTPPTS